MWLGKLCVEMGDINLFKVEINNLIMRYEEWVETLAREQSEENLLQYGKEQALISLRSLVKYSKKIIRIWDHEFPSDFYESSNFLEPLDEFLNEGGDLKIIAGVKLVERPVLHDLLHKHGKISKDKIGFFERVDRWANNGKNNINFLVSDSLRYRQELDNGGDNFALVKFNDPVTAKSLEGVFDKKYLEFF